MNKVKIICRIKGGIGNQLFCYAAARRLALINKADLVVDNISGFVRDHRYQRQYQLAHFNVSTRLATSSERMVPLERIRRFLLKKICRIRPFSSRKYLEQENNDFDQRLLTLKVNGKIYLDGYWQSERYFEDIEDIIRQELQIIPPKDVKNKEIAQLIINSNAICIHVRWFDNPLSNSLDNNIEKDYYDKAIAYLTQRVNGCHFFVFSDHPNETETFLELPTGKATFISHNKGDENAYADLWLMTLCNHFIIANSTFSWWGAWLSANPNKIVVAPKHSKNGEGSWGFKGLIPKEWILI